MLERTWICRHLEDQQYQSSQRQNGLRWREEGGGPSSCFLVGQGGVSFLVLLFWVAFSFLGGDGMSRRRVFEGGVAVLRHGRRGTVWLSMDRRDVKKFFNVEIEISPKSDGGGGNIYEYINVANRQYFRICRNQSQKTYNRLINSKVTELIWMFVSIKGLLTIVESEVSAKTIALRRCFTTTNVDSSMTVIDRQHT